MQNLSSTNQLLVASILTLSICTLSLYAAGEDCSVPANQPGSQAIMQLSQSLEVVRTGDRVIPPSMAIKSSFGKRLFSAIFFRNATGYIHNEHYNEALIEEGEQIKIPTLDDLPGANRPHLLNAVWAKALPAQNENNSNPASNLPTVILLPGVGDTAESMTRIGNYFREIGVNTLAISYRGHPGSEGNLLNSAELGVLLDAEAATRYALERLEIPHDKLVIFGRSMGGPLAVHMGKLFDLPVFVDQTYTSIKDVMGGAAANMIRPLWLVPTALTLASVDHLADVYFRPGHRFSLPTNHPSGKREIVTNGLNTLKMVRNLPKKLFVIYSKKDGLMPYHFHRKILEAKYPKLESETHGIWQDRISRYVGDTGENGDHGIVFSQTEETRVKIKNFLEEIGILPGSVN